MITTVSVKEGGASRPSDPTVKVTVVRRFAYPVIEDGEWVSKWFEEGEKLDMNVNHVQKHINANLVKRTPGRKKAVQVEENK